MDDSKNDPQQLSLFSSLDTYAQEHWHGMPEFMLEDLEPRYQLTVSFASRTDRDKFAALVGQKISDLTRSIWFPAAEIDHAVDKKYITDNGNARLRFPIYIPSKGRAAFCLTMRVLDSFGIDYYVIVEAQEYSDYANTIRKDRLLVLDPAYQDKYDYCDTFGGTKPRGSGPARNMAWDHAVAAGAPWHWVIDDNLHGFYRFNRNLKIPVADATILRCIEDFALRYDNLAMCGPNYEMFVKRKQIVPPFILNTRIYSCNLIRCDLPFRWRARYNEDTDLSLRILKAGWCTVLFNAFLQYKAKTQLYPGGNTDTLYLEGTRAKTAMLVDLHPDVASFATKFNNDDHYLQERVHHHVNYSGFRQRLRLRPDVNLPHGINEYDMKIISSESGTGDFVYRGVFGTRRRKP